jgi:hypothetical protein
MLSTFQSTYASTIGHTHRKMGYNNQDAIRVIDADPNAFIAVVADGCGSKSNSEVGAQLAVHFVAAEIARLIAGGQDWRELLQHAHGSWAERFVAGQQVEDRVEFIGDFMLYTLLGVVVEDEVTTIFRSGDGLFMVNGEVTAIDQQNQPAYLNYELMGRDKPEMYFEQFVTDEIDSLLVGTDGVEDLHGIFRTKKWGGYPSLVGLCEDPKMYHNQIALSKLIFEASEIGELHDDTTLVMVKRNLIGG